MAEVTYSIDQTPQRVEFSNIQMIWPYTMAPASAQPDVNNTDVDGRDFLVWQRGNAPGADDQDFYHGWIQIESIHLLGQPATETLDIAHVGF